MWELMDRSAVHDRGGHSSDLEGVEEAISAIWRGSRRPFQRSEGGRGGHSSDLKGVEEAIPAI